MRVIVTGPKDNGKVSDGTLVYTVSRSKGWSKGLSPFFLGPCKLYGDYTAKNVENGWQFSKVYGCHIGNDGNPDDRYFEWATTGWNDSWAHRYPMGKGAKPRYSWWDGKKLGYIEARKKIYVPLYYKAVKDTDAYKRLKDLYSSCDLLYLWDFDGYNEEDCGMTLKDVLNDPSRPMGHAFILKKMLLEGI